MRRRVRLAAGVLVAVCLTAGAVGVLKLRSSGGDTRQAGSPEARLVLDGETFRPNGGASLQSLRLDPRDSRLIHVETRDVLSVVPRRCQRRTVVDVVTDDAGKVVLRPWEYRRVDRGPEDQCPFPESESAWQTVRLRQPLGSRDVYGPNGRWPLFVQDRQQPGASPVRGTRSCSPITAADSPSLDYANFIRYAGHAYVNRGVTVTPGTVFGKQLGAVRCRLDGSLTPTFGYRGSDGDAAYLDEGAPFYAVRGMQTSEAVGAVFNGQRLVFKADPTFD